MLAESEKMAAVPVIHCRHEFILKSQTGPSKCKSHKIIQQVGITQANYVQAELNFAQPFGHASHYDPIMG